MGLINILQSVVKYFKTPKQDETKTAYGNDMLLPLEDREKRKGITKMRNDIPDHYIDDCEAANPATLHTKDYSKVDRAKIREIADELKKDLAK